MVLWVQISWIFHVITEYLVKNSNNYLKVKLSILYYQAKQYEEAKKLLSEISDFTNFNLLTQFLIVRAYRLCGLKEKGYALAYELRRKNFQDEIGHKEYEFYSFPE